MKHLIILFFIFSCMTCSCQQKPKTKEIMYLIMSHDINMYSNLHERTNLKVSDTSFVSLLLKMDNKRLIIADTLNFDHRLNNEVSHIIHFDEFEFITIGEGEKDNTHSAKELLAKGEHYEFKGYFNILDYSNGSIVKRKAEVDLLSPPHGAGSENRGYIIRDTFKIECCNNDDLSNGKSFYNLSDKNASFVTPLMDTEWMNNYYVKNHSGYLPASTINYPIDTFGNVRKRNSAEANPYKWQISNFDYPRVQSEMKAVYSFNILYNTQNSNYQIGYKAFRDEFKDLNYKTIFYKLDKATKEWSELHNLPSAKFNVYNDDYLYGTLRDFKGIQGEALEDTIAQYALRHPNKYSTKYSTIPNTSFMNGKFFIYHVPKQREIEYKGEDVDTELLFIKDDWVYFRDFDKIKRVKLDVVGFSLDKKSEETICQDRERIPNVHHIFWASDAPIKVEWLSPKPKNIK